MLDNPSSKTQELKLNRFLNLARSLALSSDFYRFKHGACIVKKGHVIATGINIYKSHPLQRQYNNYRSDIETDAPHYMHAEICALTKAIKQYPDLSDAQIYIYRVSESGKPAMSRPCAACIKAIADYGIKTIYYTTNAGFAQEQIGLKDLYIIPESSMKKNKKRK